MSDPSLLPSLFHSLLLSLLPLPPPSSLHLLLPHLFTPIKIDSLTISSRLLSLLGSIEDSKSRERLYFNLQILMQSLFLRQRVNNLDNLLYLLLLISKLERMPHSQSLLNTSFGFEKLSNGGSFENGDKGFGFEKLSCGISFENSPLTANGPDSRRRKTNAADGKIDWERKVVGCGKKLTSLYEDSNRSNVSNGNIKNNFSDSLVESNRVSGEAKLTKHDFLYKKEGLSCHKTILRDLLYVLQGINGDSMSYNKLENKFEIKNDNLTLSERILLEKMSELGWLHKKIDIFLNTNLSKSITRKYFAEVLSQEMQDYHSFIATLEQQIRNIDSENNNKLFSFRKIYIFMLEPLEKLKYLNILIDNIDMSNNDASVFLNIVFNFLNMGSPGIQSLFARIFRHVVKPMLLFIEKWMIFGEIQDFYSEFFVHFDPNAVKDNNYFISFSLKANLPKFWELKTLKNVLKTGKTVNFLTKNCNYSTEGASLGDIDDFNHLNFEKRVNERSRLVDQQVTSVLTKEFNLIGHLDYLKEFLLFGKSDLIFLLIDNMGLELEKPIIQVFQHNLIAITDQIIKTKQSFGKERNLRSSDLLLNTTKNHYFPGRITPKLLNSGGNCYCWEVFSFDYLVEGPIGVIIGNEERLIYSKIFNFLMRLSYCEQTLSQIYKENSYLNKKMREMRKEGNNFFKINLARIIQQSCLLENQIKHSISNILNFLLLEVIHKHYNIFLTQILPQSSSLEEIMQNHKEFLKTLEKNFLTFDPQISTEINNILMLVSKFKFCQNLIVEKTEIELDRLRRARMEKEMHKILELNRTVDSFVNQNNNDNEDIVFLPHFQDGNSLGVDKLLENLEFLKKEYTTKIMNLYILLKKDKSEGYRFLARKLNFNEFYALEYEGENNNLSFYQLTVEDEKEEKKVSVEEKRGRRERESERKEKGGLENIFHVTEFDVELDGEDYINVFNDKL